MRGRGAGQVHLGLAWMHEACVKEWEIVSPTRMLTACIGVELSNEYGSSKTICKSSFTRNKH